MSLTFPNDDHAFGAVRTISVAEIERRSQRAAGSRRVARPPHGRVGSIHESIEVSIADSGLVVRNQIDLDAMAIQKPRGLIGWRRGLLGHDASPCRLRAVVTDASSRPPAPVLGQFQPETPGAGN
jgi:hypothetical protein